MKTKKKKAMLDAARGKVVEWLLGKGVNIPPGTKDINIAAAAEWVLGVKPQGSPDSMPGAASRFIAILVMAHTGKRPDLYAEARKAKASRKKRKAAAPKRVNFYHTPEWKAARYDALKASNGACQACGASPATRPGTVLNVDHIQPISKRWDLRLNPDNLQVLCGSCNVGKGARDATDWRPHSPMAHPYC